MRLSLDATAVRTIHESSAAFAILLKNPYRVRGNPDGTMRLFALLLTFCVCAPLAAQSPIPDTTEAWRYFPLEIGEVREYEVFIMNAPPCLPGCFHYWRRTVVGDSTIEGFTYRHVVRDEFDSNRKPYNTRNEFFRMDTTAAEIYWSFNALPYGGTICGLDAPFPPPESEIECDGGKLFSVTGEGYEQTIQIGTDTVITAVKKFSRYFESFTYAADIGLINQVYDEGASFYYTLTYANVDGVEYGSPFPVAVEPEGASQHGFALSAAYPNPFADAFSVVLASPTPQGVTLEVFDLLGRRVYSEEHVAGAGETTLRLDATGWPRGLYLVRVTTADGQTATTRITRQ